jgi:hypothetical protein
MMITITRISEMDSDYTTWEATDETGTIIAGDNDRVSNADIRRAGFEVTGSWSYTQDDEDRIIIERATAVRI